MAFIPQQHLFDIGSLSDEDAYRLGEQQYADEFLNFNGRSGEIVAHDGEKVKFFADRYEHAFRTSKNRAQFAYDKSKIDRRRIERILWIQPIISGEVESSECWEVPLDMPPNTRPFPGKRLYLFWEESYQIWLEPLRKGGFKFSSAYCSSPADLGRYTKYGRKIWSNRT